MTGRLRPRRGSSTPSQGAVGDYSTNVAMLLAPSLGAAPREVAERVGTALAEWLGAELSARRSRARASST